MSTHSGDLRFSLLNHYIMQTNQVNDIPFCNTSQNPLLIHKQGFVMYCKLSVKSPNSIIKFLTAKFRDINESEILQRSQKCCFLQLFQEFSSFVFLLYIGFSLKYEPNAWDFFLANQNDFRLSLFFSNFFSSFLNPIFFNSNSNCFNVLDLGNLREQLQKHSV